jgi:hypothetical protein
MTSNKKINQSLELLFLSVANTRDLKAYIGRDVRKEMIAYANKRNLDDTESVQDDLYEALEYVNIEFSKPLIAKPYEGKVSKDGAAYPKYYISDGVEDYNVEGMRQHDAQVTQEVYRTNANFRYGNVIKPWEVSLYTRNYDRDPKAQGLRDTREIANVVSRKYDMSMLSGENPYKSSDSYLYDYSL